MNNVQTLELQIAATLAAEPREAYRQVYGRVDLDEFHNATARTIVQQHPGGPAQWQPNAAGR